ncbi:type II CAAX prenyl endopeptidase Rce1 family protein [Novosphingobium sp.]|uniref:CPBP family glutamic-type intramembrane protease n=1 Tax=Novosphingobium sp. TaxID=1874826 RepID=UPI00286BCA33|nr:CPBP family glutamic-type intramembrane protease [Novosphingobium sp.]
MILPARTLRTTLGQFGAFLRRPQLLAPQGLLAQGSGRTWLWLTALLIAVLFALVLPFIRLWQGMFDLADPVAFEAVPQRWLMPIVVLFAPLSEELLFRGWQSGTRAALCLLGCAVLVIVAMMQVIVPGREMIALGLLAAAVLGGVAGWFVLRRNRAPLGWFARGFPVIFYLMAALFAVVHLANYGRFSLLALPLVLPQLWAGLVLGYVRQRIGLAGAIASHAASNGLVVALALVSG